MTRRAPLSSPAATQMARDYCPSDYRRGDEYDPRSPYFIEPDDTDPDPEDQP